MSLNNWNYWLAHSIMVNKNKSDGIVLFGEENLHLDIPTIMYSNHSFPEDLSNIQLSVIKGMERKTGSKPERIVRTVMADDIFLGDGNEFDYLKNHLLNAGAEFYGQILMKRKESTNPKPRIPTTKSIAKTLREGNHVLIAPMGCMTLDGRVDYVKKNSNWFFDNRAYQKIRGLTNEEFQVQPVHFTYDPVSEKKFITMGEESSSEEQFDFLKGISSCTTITAFQLVASYFSVLDRLGLELPYDKETEDFTNLSELLTDKKINVSSNNLRTIGFARMYHLNKRLGYEEPKILNLGTGSLEIDNFDYQRNQVTHLGIEKIIEEYVRGTLS